MIRAIALLLLAPSCTAPLRSCAAYVALLGPTQLTLTCPPPGYTPPPRTP